MKAIKLNDIVEKFQIEILHKSKTYDKEEITGSNVSSGAYEFTGKSKNAIHSMIGYGSKEQKIFDDMSEKELEEGLSNLKKLNVPAIILTKTFTSEKRILPILKKLDITTLKMHTRKAELHSILGTFLSREFTEQETVHASLVNVFGYGVLITGKPGIGKSETTLELISNRHFFVADDAINVVSFAGELYGKSNTITKDHLEVRGIGIVNVRRMYGVQYLMEESKINLVIELTNDEKQFKSQERIGSSSEEQTIAGISIPKITINILSAKNVSQLIEAATINLKLKASGYDASKEFIKQYNEKVKEK